MDNQIRAGKFVAGLCCMLVYMCRRRSSVFAATVCWTQRAAPATTTNTRLLCSTRPAGWWVAPRQRRRTPPTPVRPAARRRRRGTSLARRGWRSCRRMRTGGPSRGCRCSICGRASAARAYCPFPSTACCRRSLHASRPARCGSRPPLCTSPGPRRRVPTTTSACPTRGPLHSRPRQRPPSVSPL